MKLEGRHLRLNTFTVLTICCGLLFFLRYRIMLQARNINVHQVSWRQFSRDYELKHGRSPPPLLENWLDYAQTHSCSLDQYDGLYEDLERFRPSGITMEMVQESLKKCKTCQLITVKDQSLTHTIHLGRQFNVQWLLGPAVRTPGLEFTAVINLDDCPVVETSKDPDNRYVVLSWATLRDGTSGDIRFPYDYSLRVWNPQEDMIWGMSPWKQRKNAVVWRGSSTGTVIAPWNKWRDSIRFRLVERFGHKNLRIAGIPVDVALSAMIQCEDDAECEVAKSEYAFAIERKVPFEWFVRHRYVIDVDGNSFSVRFVPLLRSASVVLKAGLYKQWFWERVLPWTHYIPVDPSFDDLETQVAWAVQHPEAAEKIGETAAKLAAQRLRDVDSRCYSYRLMVEYAALFDQ